VNARRPAPPAGRQQRWHGVLALALGVLLVAMAGCASPPFRAGAELIGGAPAGQVARVVVIAVANPLGELPLSSGSTPGLYGRKSSYVVGAQAQALLAQVATSHGLRPLDSWPIRALGLHCATFLIPDGASRDEVLAALARDPRVALAQPLNEFGTLGVPAAPSAPAPPASAGAGQPTTLYNDPYLPLQRGLLALGVPPAHRCARGDGVRVAVIDTGVDTAHQDLLGAQSETANFVDQDMARFRRDRHGTEVAGVIAARPGNATGIVGIAPGASLLALKACWERPDGSSACNSFTLSMALAAAIERGAQVINLSLGGPADALLDKLLRLALSRGVVVVGALPPSGLRDGFPLSVPGVIAVQDGAAPPRAGTQGAPAREVLTLMPGGRYDFASGTSLAAAHVSGIVALLLQHGPRLDGARLERALRESSSTGELAQVNACRALESVEPGCRCSAVR
jgi:hypothetical protein